MSPVETKTKTIGVDPKVPVQAVATVLTALVAYFGINLDPEVSMSLAVLIGTAAGVLAPAPETVEVPA